MDAHYPAWEWLSLKAAVPLLVYIRQWKSSLCWPSLHIIAPVSWGQTDMIGDGLIEVYGAVLRRFRQNSEELRRWT